MNCDYWKDIVAELHTDNCVWASHVLSTDLHAESDLSQTNLGTALEYVSLELIIEGTIYSYRDWDSQPYCDLILARFDAEKILSVYLRIDSPDSNMKAGVLRILEDIDRQTAKRLAQMLNNPDESEKVLSEVRYTLRAT